MGRAQDAFKAMLRDPVAPALRGTGFVASRQNRAPQRVALGAVGLPLSSTLEGTYWHSRIGSVIPGRLDRWWRIARNDGAADVAEAVVAEFASTRSRRSDNA